MSKKFEKRKQLEKVVRTAKMEVLFNWHQLEANTNEEYTKDLEYAYAVSSRRYLTLLDILNKFLEKTRKVWLNNKVNANRLRSRMNTLLKKIKDKK